MVQLKHIPVVIRVEILDFGEKLPFGAVCQVFRGSSIPETEQRVLIVIAVILSRNLISFVLLCDNHSLVIDFKFTCTEPHAFCALELERTNFLFLNKYRLKFHC